MTSVQSTFQKQFEYGQEAMVIVAPIVREQCRVVVDDFLFHFPQHRPSLADSDPLVVVLHVIFVFALSIWELRSVYSGIRWLVRVCVCNFWGICSFVVACSMCCSCPYKPSEIRKKKATPSPRLAGRPIEEEE